MLFIIISLDEDPAERKYKMKKTAIILSLCMLLTACSAIDNVPTGGDIEDAVSADTSAVSEASDTVTEITDSDISENITESDSEDIPETQEGVVSEESGTSPETAETTAETKAETAAENILPDGITLSTYDITVTVGGSQMPIVTMSPENCTDKSEIWTSDNEDIASVDNMGRITGKSAGECTVTVRAAANEDVSAQVKVTVTETQAGLTYIDGILIVNKTYELPADYNPGVQPEAQAAFDRMQKAAWAEGLNIWIASGFRSYEYQSGLYDRYVNRSGKAEADRYSARPGHSEHQTGLAFDLNSIENSFADTAEGKWVAEHCHEYGFIIRYPKGSESITGYIYEPWHIRYLGEEKAESVYNSGLTLEEYLGITSKYAE